MEVPSRQNGTQKDKTMPGSGGEKVTLDDPVLRSGVVIYTGATDRAGRPLVTFPTRCQLKLHNPQTCAQIPSVILYYMRNTHGPPKRCGWSFLADFRCSTKEALCSAVQVLDTLQETSRGCVTVFYCIQPKQKNLQKKLRKLVGLKPSKKNPKIAVFKTVIFSEPTELHQVMDMSHVTADFGGTLQYNHEAWLNFKQVTDEVLVAMEQTVRSIPAAVDRVTMLQEYEVPSAPGDLTTLLERLQDKYHSIVRDLKIEVVIDQCKDLHQKLSRPQDYTNFTDMSHLPMFIHIVNEVTAHQRALVNGRMELQSLWRAAESRLTQTFQLHKYNDKAQKVLTWIRQVGLPVANEEPQVADSLSQAQVNKAYYEAGFLTVAKNVLALASRIQKKLETIVMDSSPDHRKEALEVNRKLTASSEQFKIVVEKTRLVYDNVYNFHLLTAKVCTWYRRTLQFLPTHALRRTPSGGGRHSRQEKVFPSSRLMTPQWHVSVSQFVTTHTPPRSNYLQGIREGIPLIKDTWTRSQARLLIHRVAALRRLLMCPDLVSNVELSEVLRWKETAIYGYDDLDFSVAATGIEQVGSIPLDQPAQGTFRKHAQPYGGSWTESSESLETTEQQRRGTKSSRHFISRDGATGAQTHNTQTLPSRKHSSSHLREKKQQLRNSNLINKHKSMGAIDSIKQPSHFPKRLKSGHLPAGPEHSFGIHGDSEEDSALSDSENLHSNRSSDERYVSLQYRTSRSAGQALPSSLKHLDLQALHHNMPQEDSSYPDQRYESPHRQDSVTDSGLGPARSGTDMSRLSLSTPGISPQHNESSHPGFSTHYPSPIQGAKSLPDISEGNKLELCQADLEKIASSNLNPDIKMKLMAAIANDTTKLGHTGVETTYDTQNAAYSLADISSALHSTLKTRPVQQSTPNLKIHTQAQSLSHPRTKSPRYLLGDTLESPEHLRDAAGEHVANRVILEGSRLDKSIASPAEKQHASHSYSANEIAALLAEDVGRHGDSMQMREEELDDVDFPEIGVDIEAWLDGREDTPADKMTSDALQHDITRLQAIHQQRKQSESELAQEKQRLTDLTIDEEASKQEDVARSLRTTDVVLQEQEKLFGLKPAEIPMNMDMFTSLPLRHQEESMSSNTSDISSVHPYLSTVPNILESASEHKVEPPVMDSRRPYSEESGYSSRTSAAGRRQLMMEVFKARLNENGGSKALAESDWLSLRNSPTESAANQNTRSTNPVMASTRQTSKGQGSDTTQINNELPASKSPGLSVVGSRSHDLHSDSTSFESEGCAEGERSQVDDYHVSEVKGEVVMGSRVVPACVDIAQVLHVSTFDAQSFKTPIIIDNGSGLCKCGLADQVAPSVIFPAFVGRAKYDEIGTSNHVDCYVGEAAQNMRGVLKLNYPLKHGIVTDWEAMEKIWHHAFFDQLRVEPNEHPVMVTEAPLNPLRNRERLAEMMFETFQVPALYVVVQAVLALMATGKHTGIVLDCGDGVTHIVPVYSGCSLPHAVTRLDLAGRDLTHYMTKLLQQAGYSFTTTAEQEIVRDIKEQLCYVAQDYDREMNLASTSASYESSYELPDGREIWISSEKFRCPEALFDPSLLGREHAGIHQVLYDVVQKCDVDIRQELLSNILLSGGSTMFPGLADRLKTELSKLTQRQDVVNVNNHDDGQFLVWKGGALLANLPNFSQSWITREEYQEYGSAIVHRKCF